MSGSISFALCTGKAGALLGALVIGYLFTSARVSLRVALAVLACTNFVGFFCCSLIPEPMQLQIGRAHV